MSEVNEGFLSTHLLADVENQRESSGDFTLTRVLNDYRIEATKSLIKMCLEAIQKSLDSSGSDTLVIAVKRYQERILDVLDRGIGDMFRAEKSSPAQAVRAECGQSLEPVSAACRMQGLTKRGMPQPRRKKK